MSATTTGSASSSALRERRGLPDPLRPVRLGRSLPRLGGRQPLGRPRLRHPPRCRVGRDVRHRERPPRADFPSPQGLRGRVCATSWRRSSARTSWPCGPTEGPSPSKDRHDLQTSTPTSSFVARSTSRRRRPSRAPRRSSASTWGSSGTPGTSSRTTHVGRSHRVTRGARIDATPRGRSIGHIGSPVAMCSCTGVSPPRSSRRRPGPSSRSTSTASWSIWRRTWRRATPTHIEATYAILNGSRIVRALETADVAISKRAAGLWGVEHLPDRWHPALRAAGRNYDDQASSEDIDLIAQRDGSVRRDGPGAAAGRDAQGR